MRCGCICVVAAWLLAAAPARAAECPNSAKVNVPGAEMQTLGCLDDMTTTATATTTYTDASDWASLAPTGQKKPSGVPGLQVDGYFPDTSTTNYTHGWFHDSQFVIRLPEKWNGKLILTGAPGTRKQYAHDPIISDWVISKGYAYGSTDKGNGGVAFYNDGVEPGDAGVEWNTRVTELAVAAKQVVAQYYGRAPDRTYMTGVSQGGYLTRWQLENRPELYDGGVDWEGTFWNSSAPNIFTSLSAAIRNYPTYKATRSRVAHDAMIAAGYAAGSEFLWEDHYGVYWDLTQRTYREEFDPAYDGQITAGVPFCQSGTPMCDADYDYASRPEEVKAAVRRVENTGRIGKPMLTLHGTLDTLLPIATNGDPYTARLRAAGFAARHRYYVIEHGNHVDGRYDLFPDRIRPIWPCWAKALEALEGWVEHGKAPPPSQFVPDNGGDVLADCTLASGPAVAGDGPTPVVGASTATATADRARGKRLTLRVAQRGTRRFRASGKLVLAKGVVGCGSGTVAVQFKTKRRTISTRYPRLHTDCTYRSEIVFKRLGRGRLNVTARFFGNRAVKAISARRVTLRGRA